ncbi:hypothetical protein QU487_11325 [Crenobacter sp. SG2305]|uniref:hypothetical protein n=1 Tax=Crenobacter oryzisoli TaxID=3056844 RepID=UPI0025AA52CF|nr:hypothetical protein [Crenobacter sp. SG2305]MDN0083337.1 hypothetical protein [Crenobacter sp. SG2305]
MPKPALKYSEAAISGLCPASSTILSLNVAFLGLWAFADKQANTHWSRLDYLILAIAFLGFCCLAATPWCAASPHESDPTALGARRARSCFCAGVSLTLLWIGLAILESVFD